MNPNDMTLDQCRDWCAEDDGWKYQPGPIWQWQKTTPEGYIVRLEPRSDEHPFPPTIDGAASALPEPWRSATTVYIGHSITCVTSEVNGRTVRAEGSTEILARYRLAVACRMAAKEQA